MNGIKEYRLWRGGFGGEGFPPRGGLGVLPQENYEI